MAALALLLVCVSGVCLRRDFFRNFLAFRPGENRFAFWRDAHGVAGGLTLPFFLVITASGLVLLAQSLLPSTLFPHYRDGARNFVRESKGAGIMQPPSPTARTLPVTPLSEEYGSVPDPAPLLELAARRWPDCGAGSLLIRFHDGNVISMQAMQARSSALSRRSSADLLELRVIPGMDRGEVLDPRTETPPSFIRSVWYAASALHLGRFAAPLPRALLFLSGLLSAGMMAARAAALGKGTGAKNRRQRAQGRLRRKHRRHRRAAAFRGRLLLDEPPAGCGSAAARHMGKSDLFLYLGLLPYPRMGPRQARRTRRAACGGGAGSRSPAFPQRPDRGGSSAGYPVPRPRSARGL